MSSRAPQTMVNHSMKALRRVATVGASVIVLKVTGETVLGYRNYFPANFESDFLLGRQEYFFGAYQWAFYPHLASGPLALLLGLLLMSEPFRLWFPKWHRNLGRIHVMNVLAIVVPSGLWMAGSTSTGTIAGIGFGVQAVLTGVFTAFGWRAAVLRKFAVHRRWMWRSYLLLSGAVVLRVVVGLATVAGVQALWFDPVVSWLSWLLPLLIFELSRLKLWKRTPTSTAPAVDCAQSNTVPSASC